MPVCVCVLTVGTSTGNKFISIVYACERDAARHSKGKEADTVCVCVCLQTEIGERSNENGAQALQDETSFT